MNSLINKKELRKQLKEKRSKLTIKEIAEYSIKIHNKLISTKEYKASDVILAYVSFSSEVGTHMLIKHALENGKKVACPKVINNDHMEFYLIDSFDELAPGAFGILEPNTLKPLEYDESKIILLLPGLAFDKEFNRLGYGGGYYDKYLSNHKDITKIMLAYELEEMDVVPTEEWDIKSDIIITEERILKR